MLHRSNQPRVQSPPKLAARASGTPDAPRSARLGSLANTLRQRTPVRDARPNFCQTHSRPIELFCMTCNAYLCPDCTNFSLHFQHKLVTSREAEGRSSFKNEGLSLDLQNLRAEVAKRAATFKSDWQARKSTLLSESQAFFGEAVKKLEARRADSQRIITEFFDFALAAFQRKREELDAVLTDLAAKARMPPGDPRGPVVESVERLRRQVLNLTLEAFPRHKISFVIHKEWRGLLDQICALENCQNQSYSPIWEESDLETDPAPPTPVSFLGGGPLSSRRRESRSPLLPGGGEPEDLSNFRTLNKNHLYLPDIQGGAENESNKANHNSGSIGDMKTPRFNLRVESDSADPKERNLLFNRKSLFYRTMLSARNQSLGKDEPPAQEPRKLFNKSLVDTNEIEILTAGTPRLHPRNASSNVPREAPEPRSNSRQVAKSFGEFLPSLNFSRKSLTVEALIRLFSETVIQGPVKCLELSENGINDVGLKKILKKLVSLRFAELDLSRNRLSKHSLDYLLSFSNYNDSLKLVDLRGNDDLAEDQAYVLAKVSLLGEKGIRVLQ